MDPNLCRAPQKGGSTISFFNPRDEADFIPDVRVFMKTRDESNIALVFADRYLASFCLAYPPELTCYLTSCNHLVNKGDYLRACRNAMKQTRADNYC